jgi:hypothetical protein
MTIKVVTVAEGKPREHVLGLPETRACQNFRVKSGS